MSAETTISHLAPVWSRLVDEVVDHGKGCYLSTADGRTYLDFTSGIGVTNTGHCHPRVVDAIRDQAGKMLHAQLNVILHRPLLDLVDELRTVVPPSLDTFFVKTSGSETVEAAVKLSRTATKRPNIIVFQGSFHGRTVATMSMTTSKTTYRAGYQPLMAGVFVAPFPYSYRYGWDPETTVDWCLRELKYLLRTQTAPAETAAMVVEPVLGEGGYVVPPPGFLEGLRSICDKHGILLILDEIQSGFGRTGRWFAHQHFDVSPDIMVMAKGLASGLPLAAVAAPTELMGRWSLGAEGGTYNGNILACAAAVATIQTIREEGLVEDARLRGEQLMSGLGELQDEYPQIGDVRGLGLMVGVEFTDSEGKPDKKSATLVQQACKKEGLLLLTCGTWGNTIRIIPPLPVTADEISDGLERFETALGSTLR